MLPLWLFVSLVSDIDVSDIILASSSFRVWLSALERMFLKFLLEWKPLDEKLTVSFVDLSWKCVKWVGLTSHELVDLLSSFGNP